MAYKTPDEILKLRDKTISQKIKDIAEEQLEKESSKAKEELSMKERWSSLYPVGNPSKNEHGMLEPDKAYAQNITPDDIKKMYQDMVNKYINKDRGTESKRLNKVLNSLREMGVISDENGKLTNIDTSKLNDWDVHFKVANDLYDNKAEGAKKGMDLLQDFAKENGIELKVSSAHRSEDHKLSKEAEKNNKESDHTKGNAVDVSRIKITNNDGEEQELDWRSFISSNTPLYRKLVKKMTDAGFYYINEKIDSFNHGHFAKQKEGSPYAGVKAVRISYLDENGDKKYTIRSQLNSKYVAPEEDKDDSELTLSENVKLQPPLLP